MSTGLKVNLACPKCGEPGLVDWRNLKNGIGCPKCGCQFLIGRNGRVLSQSELPHVRFTCPRCKQSGSVPTMLAERGTKCAGCALRLVFGPDRRLHDVKEAEEMSRLAAAVPSGPSRTDRIVARFMTNDGRVRLPTAVGSIAMLVVLIFAAGVMVGSYFDRSPEKIARHFVWTCLSGDWQAAQSYFEDNAVQLASFDRWRALYFPSILDTHRPEGDRVDVAVRMIEDRGNSKVFLVTMRSPFIGTRSHVQQWHERDGNWFFDARGTLAGELEKPPARRKRMKLSRSGPPAARRQRRWFA